MFLLRRPTAGEIDQFLKQSRDLPLSYEPVGLARTPPSAFNVDELSTLIGHGEEAFVRAKRALATWKHFELGWVELHPKGATVSPGTVVAVLVKHLGFWSLNGCRVVYPVSSDDGCRFGFAYGTLPNHAQSGEEIFELRFQPATGEVRYFIQAVARPQATLARVGYPITRALQSSFRRDSARALIRAVVGE